MFRVGEIVYHNELYFSGGELDQKKRRPCIVLFNTNIDGVDYVYTCPLTSKTKQLEKRFEDHVLIPDIVNDYRVLTIATINSISPKTMDNTFPTGSYVSDNTIDMIYRKIEQSNLEELTDLKIQLKEYLSLEKSKKNRENIEKRKRKKPRRQQAKRIH